LPSPPYKWIFLALVLSVLLCVPFLIGSAAASVANRARGSVGQRTLAQRRSVNAIGVRAVLIARRFVGVPYRYGGFSPATGFDCSGFVRFVYSRLGISLPHNAAAQFSLGSRVSRAALRPGDLVFFHGLAHVGIYVGAGRFIHAPQTGERVSIVPMSGNWASGYDGARRVT
jgi:murein DD-endopeptidase